MDLLEHSALTALEKFDGTIPAELLLIRYQQRKAVCDELRKYVRQQKEDKEWLVEEMKREEGQQNEYDTA